MKTFRTKGLLPPNARGTVIVGLGLGSAGASFFTQIPYQFGKVILADPGTLEIENIERHPLGESSLGQNKARATRDFLVNEKRVPATNVVAYTKKAEEVLPDLVGKKVHLVVCGIDYKPACRYVNQWCVENDVPAIYVGVYPFGVGGEVIAIPTPKEVCYVCAENQRATKVLAPEYAGNYGINPELLKGMGTDPDDPKAVPALMNSVTAIVSEMVPLAWRMLFPEDTPVSPQIRFRALEGWVEVARIHTKSAEFATTVKWITSPKNLLLSENNARISAVDKEGYVGLEIRRQPWPKSIVQWTRCPLHGTSVQFSDL